MKWEDLLSPKRFGAETSPDQSEPGRTSFHKDCDRITFSSSFRRLGKKTQVHPLAQNDHVHTRLTHSLEVASVGRSLGIRCGEKIKDRLPKDIHPTHVGQILQAACLSHDIGNPPFGHAGEEAIKSWFSHPSNAHILEGLSVAHQDDFKNFEGNAQGFRLLTRLEYNINEGGMRLTYASLASMLKYPWTSMEIKKTKKFSCFQSEKEFLNRIAIDVKLIKTDENLYRRHPLAYLAEAADDICYRILDLEDAHEMKILSFNEIKELLEGLCDKDSHYKEIVDSMNVSNRRKLSFIRAKAIGRAVEGIVDTFIKNHDAIMLGAFHKELISESDTQIKNPLDQAKKLSKEKVFDEPRKIELEIGCYTAIGILLEAFCSAVREQVISGENITYKSSRVLAMMGLNAPKKGDDLYQSFLKVTDYISGMTDNYASHMAKQIGGMGS
ncbi:MAG: deoxyguanosinetriphosphate triphosphohydrolase [Desulfobacteraceae bacterium]|nr:MAG: deoxyguanosinetriphosphate triphosphohydrolase [Desulfobacteraceae bacterium]